MKKVVAVRPYLYKDKMHFLNDAFEGWRNIGGNWKNHWWQPRPLHFFFYRYSIPFSFPQSKNEARLMFICASTLNFCTYGDYIRYEVIPIIWDCWPKFFKQTCDFFKRNRVKTAIFTSEHMMQRMKARFPNINYLCITEGIDPTPYSKGKELKDRTIDLVEFGRSNKEALPSGFHIDVFVHKCSENGEWVFPTNKELYEGLANSKVSLVFPRCDTQPEFAGGIETLTQRYWECMLSRIVMVGRAPFELVKLLGYNPVIDIDRKNAESQIIEIASKPEKYQPLVDRNREVALKYCNWDNRMDKIKHYLLEKGYRL